LAPHERIRYTDKFDDPNLPGAMQVTVRKESPMSFQPRLATLAGKSRLPFWRNWSRRRLRTHEGLSIFPGFSACRPGRFRCRG
jgi:hypothetical protein